MNKMQNDSTTSAIESIRHNCENRHHWYAHMKPSRSLPPPRLDYVFAEEAFCPYCMLPQSEDEEIV